MDVTDFDLELFMHNICTYCRTNVQMLKSYLRLALQRTLSNIYSNRIDAVQFTVDIFDENNVGLVTFLLFI